MNTALIILKQLITMFIYMAIGWGLFKSKLITKEGSRSLANLLLYAILPCVIIKSFCVDRTPQLLRTVGLSFIGAVIVLGLAMLIAHLIFRKSPQDDFGAAFSNAGFMGLPLISAAMGSDAVIYAAAMIALLNALQWTYGQAVLSKNWGNLSAKKVLTNPMVLALAAGLCIFLLNIPIPDLLLTCMGNIANLNAPIAMIILGVYLGEVRIRDIFIEKKVWICSLVRLLLIPAITLVVLYLVFPSQQEMALALVMVASAPVGANLAVYAQKLNQDYGYAVKIICLSTILSVVTMPLLIVCWSALCGA